MIGDWVHFQNGRVLESVQITVVGNEASHPKHIGKTVCIFGSKECPTCLQSMDTISPIPLTEEILDKNGFTRASDPLYDIPIFKTSFSDGGFYIEQWEEGFGLTDHCHIRIKYVHEFQHLLKLCGISKEIKL